MYLFSINIATFPELFVLLRPGILEEVGFYSGGKKVTFNMSCSFRRPDTLRSTVMIKATVNFAYLAAGFSVWKRHAYIENMCHSLS